MAVQVRRELVISSKGKDLTLEWNGPSLSVNTLEKKQIVNVPVRQVIWAEVAGDSLELCFLTKKRNHDAFQLEKVEGREKVVGKVAVATEWAKALMDTAYEGIKRCRRLKVLVNPHGGVGKAPTVFNKIVEPILLSARCSLDVSVTTHHQHAYEIAKDLALNYDAVMTLSGDGLIHEVLNGFAQHEQPMKAFAMPVVPCPCGSGNALSLNLLGIKDGFDVAAAALNVIKGRPMKTDLFSITQKDRRTYSFMSQALGLIADADIGTENLRWMGDTRFLLGLIRGVIHLKPCPVTLSIKIVEQDKHKMVDALQSRQRDNAKIQSYLDENAADLSTLKYSADNDGWITFDKPFLYVYAGQGPYVARDFMTFPVSLPDDGLIDVTAQGMIGRRDFLAALSGAKKGDMYWMDTHYYFKAHAYRVKPFSQKGAFAVDGEAFPFEEFQVEVHPKLATFLSPLGYYAVDFQSAGRKGNKA